MSKCDKLSEVNPWHIANAPPIFITDDVLKFLKLISSREPQLINKSNILIKYEESK